jgi:hypothetical protein
MATKSKLDNIPLNLQYLTCFPGTDKHIDYVIIYEKIDENDAEKVQKNADILSIREDFFEYLG